MSRTFSTELECGCLIAETNTDGWEGLSECFADWYDEEDLKDEKNRKHKELHDRCWEKYRKESNENGIERNKE